MGAADAGIDGEGDGPLGGALWEQLVNTLASAMRLTAQIFRFRIKLWRLSIVRVEARARWTPPRYAQH